VDETWREYMEFMKNWYRGMFLSAVEPDEDGVYDITSMDGPVEAKPKERLSLFDLMNPDDLVEKTVTFKIHHGKGIDRGPQD